MDYKIRCDQIFFTVMKKIYSHGGYVPLAELAAFLKLDQKRALEFFQDYPTYFKICYEKDPTSKDEKVVVLGVTKVKFCVKHASKPGSCLGCDGLHVCKFYSLGNSCKFGDSCNFGHSFKDSMHNERILGKHHLLQLDELELKCLFQKIENRCEVTTPDICKYFNRGSCEKSNCLCLHICRYYLMNECRYGKKCKISHNFNGNDHKILKIYGIVTSSISDALAKLRVLYQVEEYNKMNDVKKSELICLHHLSPKGCGFGDKCRHHHKEMPYQWCYRTFLSEDNDEWHDFSPLWNEEIEKKFCNLEDETHIIDKKKSSAKFQLSNMKCSIAKQEYTLQRLSTPSYKSDAKSPLATTWIWYWKDNDDIWIEYGSSTAKLIDATNEDIEETYLENPTGMMIITRKANQKKIRIDFQEMIQNGKRTREIIRRPRFISSEDAQTLRKQTLGTSNNMRPTNWKIPDDITDLSSYFNISLVDEKSEEYESVSEKFHDSMKDFAVIKIERIENGNLWESYKWKKVKMLKEASKPEDINEKYLFHGTDFESIEAICKQGFDVRLSGTAVGSKYGKGIYFSKDSAFAHNYTIASDGEHKLFFAYVLTGEFIKGKLDYVRPPPKNSAEKGGKLYDSCVDDISGPKLFVIFANEQAYPAYVITYHSTN